MHPARLPNDCRGQVSWLPDRCRRPAFPVSPSGVVERGSPVTVAGAAEASNLVPSASQEANFRLVGPATRANRDVAAGVSIPCGAVHLWHAAVAVDAARLVRAYAKRRTMTSLSIPAEPRPRDFTARLPRDAGAIAARRRRRHAGRRLGVLAAAIAVPTMAAPVDWPPAAALSAPAVPMAFETPGESFPGSAFYYLDDLPNLRTAAAPGPAGAAELALPRPPAGLLDSGPAARSMQLVGTVLDRARAQQCLTMAIYYEAASEPDAGQRAVAQVVLNRVAHPTYPDTVCGVVFQGSERATGCQFSFTCDGSLARKPAKMWWDRAASVARAALAGGVYAPVGLATHYHTVQVHPYWADSLDHVGTIGAHRFYRWRGAAGRSLAFSDSYRGGEPIAAPAPRRAEPAPAFDPIELARAYEAAHEGVVAVEAAPVRPAPAYASEIEARGGDGLFRAHASPAIGQVREEYARSGQWLRQP